MELRYAHLGHRHTPMREAQRAETARYVAEIQAEQERINLLRQAALESSSLPPT